jgi:hypothetical protein
MSVALLALLALALLALPATGHNLTDVKQRPCPNPHSPTFGIKKICHTIVAGKEGSVMTRACGEECIPETSACAAGWGGGTAFDWEELPCSLPAECPTGGKLCLEGHPCGEGCIPCKQMCSNKTQPTACWTQDAIDHCLTTTGEISEWHRESFAHMWYFHKNINSPSKPEPKQKGSGGGKNNAQPGKSKDRKKHPKNTPPPSRDDL